MKSAARPRTYSSNAGTSSRVNPRSAITDRSSRFSTWYGYVLYSSVAANRDNVIPKCSISWGEVGSSDMLSVRDAARKCFSPDGTAAPVRSNSCSDKRDQAPEATARRDIEFQLKGNSVWPGVWWNGVPLLKHLDQQRRQCRVSHRQHAFIVDVVVDLTAGETGNHRNTFSRRRQRTATSMADCILDVNTPSKFGKLLETDSGANQ